MTPAPVYTPSRPIHIVLLIAILLVAGGLRCFHLAQNSLWLDEYFSLECSSGWGRTDLKLLDTGHPAPDLITLHNARPWWQIIPNTARDENHPPLFFLMLRGWRVLLGDSPAALRSLAVVGGMVILVLIYAVGVTMASPGAALTACALGALAWPAIQRCQDARAYPWRTACLLAAAWGLVRIERFGVTPFRLLLLFAGTLLAPLLHYSAFATIAASILYVLLVMRGKPQRVVLLTMGAALLVYSICWLPHVIGQRQNMIAATAWLADEPTAHLRVTLRRLALQPVRLFIEPGSDSEGNTIACAGFLGYFAPALLLRRDRRFLLLWLWTLVPIGVELLVDLCFHRASLGDMKYTLAAGPAAYLLVGVAATAVRRVGMLIPAVIALAELLCLPNVYTSDRPDWRPMAAYLAAHTGPNDPLLLIDQSATGWPAGYTLVGLQYQLGPSRPMYLLSHVPTPEQIQDLLDRQGAAAGHLAVVGSYRDSVGLRVLPTSRVSDRQMFDVAYVATVRESVRH